MHCAGNLAGMVFDQAGNLWVTSLAMNDNGIFEFAPDGTFLNFTLDPGGFPLGLDIVPPNTTKVPSSPNSGDAIAVLANQGATTLAIVDLTKMLDSKIVPRTTGSARGHKCMSGFLPAGVVSFVTVP